MQHISFKYIDIYSIWKFYVPKKLENIRLSTTVSSAVELQLEDKPQLILISAD